MTYDEVIKFYGTAYKVSKDGGFSAGAPYNWKKQGYIPIESQQVIEKRTGGVLKASLLHLKKVSIDADKG
jgi:hypothetical protein